MSSRRTRTRVYYRPCGTSCIIKRGTSAELDLVGPPPEDMGFILAPWYIKYLALLLSGLSQHIYTIGFLAVLWGIVAVSWVGFAPIAEWDSPLLTATIYVTVGVVASWVLG